MNFEHDDEEILAKMQDSMARLEHGLEVEPTDHAPDLGPKGHFFRPVRHGGVADAVSNAGLGFLGGPMRNPPLLVGQGPDYSTIRYAEGQYAFTQVTRSHEWCSDCGRKQVQIFNVNLVRDDGTKNRIGYYGVCRNCLPDHWLFASHMNTVPWRPFGIDASNSFIMFVSLVVFAVLIFLIL